MISDDREKWDRQHAARAGFAAPSDFLQWVFQAGAWTIRPGRALDIAAGKGRNAIYLAGKGFRVDALDISDVALAEARRRADQKGLAVNWIGADATRWEFPEAAYDLVVNFNFLERSLVPKVKAAVKPGGCVIFETFLIDQRVLGHPRTPAHLLGHNELLRLFGDWRVLCYREGKFADAGTAAFRAALLAQRVA